MLSVASFGYNEMFMNMVPLFWMPPDLDAMEESSSSEVGSAAQDIEAQIKAREDCPWVLPMGASVVKSERGEGPNFLLSSAELY